MEISGKQREKQREQKLTPTGLGKWNYSEEGDKTDEDVSQIATQIKNEISSKASTPQKVPNTGSQVPEIKTKVDKGCQDYSGYFPGQPVDPKAYILQARIDLDTV